MTSHNNERKMDDKPYGYCFQRLICVFIAVLILPQTTPLGTDENVEHLFGMSARNESNEVQDLGCRSPEGTTFTVKAEGGMTALWCVVNCWKKKYKYAVIQNGKKCMCSHTQSKVVDKNECNIVCPGSKKQVCGGKKVASVFFTGLVKLDLEKLHKLYTSSRVVFNRNKSNMTGEMAAYDNLGPCVSVTPHSSLSFTTDLMSKEMCVVHCFHYKFIYAMLSAGVRCTCVSALPKDAKEFTNTRDICRAPCRGNKKDSCGTRDGTSYNVWLTGHYNEKDHLSQEDYRPVNALNQGWKSYLLIHPDAAKELTKLGINDGPTTPPPTKPPTSEGNDGDVEVDENDLTDEDRSGASGVLAGAVIAGLVAASAVLGLVLYLRRSTYSNPYGSKEDREDHKLLAERMGRSPTQSRTEGWGGFDGDVSENALPANDDDDDDNVARDEGDEEDESFANEK
ncbi:uncharacterized protein LOC124114739 [Haliotis rufescens]|uniref:uncharacterized protein LOC124114739 n=1 Tax=Haliotis rufescens TaxID=6454 RepID=UPI001EAFE202|nr:uncharacterized protein LOC124114739 [Haliotis rufescens]